MWHLLEIVSWKLHASVLHGVRAPLCVAPAFIKVEPFFPPNATTYSYELSWSPLLAVAEV